MHFTAIDIDCAQLQRTRRRHSARGVLHAAALKARTVADEKYTPHTNMHVFLCWHLLAALPHLLQVATSYKERNIFYIYTVKRVY